jgi:hypothetical protein
MDLVERRVKVARGQRRIELYFAGCLHFGHVGCDEATIKRMVDHVAADDSRYLCLLGDVIGAIGVADPRFNPREVAPWVDMGDLSDLIPQQNRRAATMLGARCGEPLPAAELERLDHFAKCIGLAFQVVDDMLDAEATTATLGKTAGKDARHNKPTYVSVLGIEGARADARRHARLAVEALAPAGLPAESLAALAGYIVERSS